MDDKFGFGAEAFPLTLPSEPFTGNGHHHEDDHDLIDRNPLLDEASSLKPELLAAFGSFIDRAHGAIGRVVGSEREPASGIEFAIWATANATSLDTGHIIVAFSEEAAVIGVVDQARRYTDVRGFLDDYIDRMTDEDAAATFIQATKRPEILVFTVRSLATKHLRDDVDSRRPPLGGPVWFATEAAIRYALGVEKYTGFTIPALLHTNGNYLRDEAGEIARDDRGRERFQRTPILLDSDYLMGPEAGHANWTGQSGLATKTSHAIFLISSAFQRVRDDNRALAAGEKPKKIAALMFNVKGSDLLWLDKPAAAEEIHAEAYQTAGALGLSEQDQAAYRAFGMTPEPFRHFRIFAPFRPKQEPAATRRESGFAAKSRPADSDDEDAEGASGGFGAPSHSAIPVGIVALDQLDADTLRRSLATGRNAAHESGPVRPILWSIDKLLAHPHRIFDKMDLDDKLFGLVTDFRDRKPLSQQQLLGWIDDAIARANADDGDGTWNGHHPMTLRKLKNRIMGLTGKFAGLLAKDAVEQGNMPAADGPFADEELRIVDIANGNTNVQEALVTSTIESIWRKAERQELEVDHLIIFVDELNKYAPAGSESGLRDTLVDIAARGRHINVVLFGAQQFRSKVESEILGNCGTSFYGRVGDEEIVNSAYRSLSPQVQSELLGLPKGKLLVRHAHFRTPLFGSFPMPPTLSGTLGQKIFNSEAGPPVQSAGDALWHKLKELMREAPSLAEVRSAALGIAPENVLEVTERIERSVRDGLCPRERAWQRARGDLERFRKRG